MMTGVDVYVAVLHELKHENTTSMTPSEFRHHIKRAMLEYINLRYWAYDQHQKPIDDLAPIHVETNGVNGNPAPIANTGLQAPKGEMFVLPTDYMHLLAVKALVKYYGEPCYTDGTMSDWIVAMHCPDNMVYQVEHHYYKKPKPEYPNLYYRHNKKTLTLMAGKSIGQQVCITYLQRPPYIAVADNGTNVQDSVFDDEQTMEIVRWCVASYTETIESYRQQSMIQYVGLTHQQYPPLYQDGA